MKNMKIVFPLVDFIKLPASVLKSILVHQRRLSSDVVDIPCIPHEHFQKIQKPIFQNVVLESLTDTDKQLIEHESMKTYFNITYRNNAAFITDHYPKKPFYQRQHMLATVYDNISRIDELSSLTVCDIGGSNGYYSFLAEPFGFKELTVSEAREVHRQQFEFIKKHVVPSSKVHFTFLEASEGVSGEYDLLLVMGILYHLYDHLKFIEELYKSTRKYLLLETALSGRLGFANLTALEDVSGNPRTGTQGVSLYPSYATVLALLKNVGFKKICRIQPPKNIADTHGYKIGNRVMLLCIK